MAQLVVRQVDDQDIVRLKSRAKARRTSVEALVREAIHEAAKLTIEEKMDLVRRMWAETEALKVPGVEQTPGWILIREGRDER